MDQHERKDGAGARPGALASAGWSVALGLSLALGLPACGGGSDGEGGEVASETSSADRRDPRPEAAEARRLLDRGRPELARPIVESLQDLLGVEGPLLLARLKVLEGDTLGWLADVERARAIDPKDPRPYATAAELYAALYRREASKDWYVRGIEAVGGRTPELMRAQGVLAISTPGAAKQGLELLEAAERADSELPFLGRALGQAYLVMAKEAMATGADELALERTAKSLEYDPDDLDARLYRGEVLMSAAQDFDSALPILEEVFAERPSYGPELGKHYWGGGIQAQIAGEVDLARDRYLRARELGSRDAQNRSARTFMTGLADAKIAEAMRAAREGDAENAEAALERALVLAGEPREGFRRTYATSIAADAQAALDAGDLDVAGRLVDLAIEADRRAPDTALVTGRYHFERALAAVEANDVEVALGHARKAAAANPEAPLRWQFLGELQHAAGDYGGAADSLAKSRDYALASDEDFPLAKSILLAECLVLSDREPEAKTALERALDRARAEALAGVEPNQLEHAEAMLRMLEDD